MIRLFFSSIITLLFTTALAAVEGKDLIGTWTIDTEATWTKLQDLPEMKALPESMKATAKDAFVTQSGGVLFTFTDKTISSTVKSEEHVKTYTIISITGDTVLIEATDAEGKTERNEIRLIEGGMELSNVAEPGPKIILKRKVAPNKSP